MRTRPYQILLRRLLQGGFDRPRDDLVYAFAQRRNIFLRHSLGLDDVMKMNGDGRGPKPPMSGAMMLAGTDQAHGHNRDAELLRHAEAALLKVINVAVAGALRFRKNDQARPAVDSVLREAPHALEIGRTANVGNRHVAKALHEPSIRRNLEVGFQLPAADVLRDRAIQHEGIK